jgi:cyclophilin family peptidyl-prolyl cis-trans isomerase
MKHAFTALALTLALIFAASLALAADKIPAHPQIVVVTTEGTFKMELVTKEAPHTVEHILKLVDAGYYDGLIFHRVISDFMIQTGGYTPGFKLKEGGQKIVNESGNGMTNVRGTVAMARSGDPHSAGSQFFINLSDNSRLDPQKSPVSGRWGYTVFGYVFEGMEVVDKIALVATAPQGEHQNAPIVPIVIKSMSQVTYD